jgi:hypothetical protein
VKAAMHASLCCCSCALGTTRSTNAAIRSCKLSSQAAAAGSA